MILPGIVLCIPESHSLKDIPKQKIMKCIQVISHAKACYQYMYSKR